MSARTELQPHALGPAVIHMRPRPETYAGIEIRVDREARRILATIPPGAARNDALAQLSIERAQLLTHVPVNGINAGVLFLNMKQAGLAPATVCPYYNKIGVPTVSNYNTIGPQNASIRMDQSAFPLIPQRVRDAAGDLAGRGVDLFWTAVDGRALVHQQRSLNLCTHHWTHPHALRGDDVTTHVPMGIFPEFGITASGAGDPARIAVNPLAVNETTLMEVYAHMRGNMSVFSPDNAHFERIPGSPFGIFWAVTKSNHRVAFTKMLVIFDNQPISALLADATRRSRNLDEFLQNINQAKGRIDLLLEHLIRDFGGDLIPLALQNFQRLPPAFQEGVFNQVCHLKGRQDDPNFGRDSFHQNNALPQELRCTNAQRAQAIQQFSAELKEILVDSLTGLLLQSQPLVKGDNVLRLIQCANLFETGQIQEGHAAFNQLPRNEQESVFFAIWELSGSPRGIDNFGGATFFHNGTNPQLKKEALLLAASRLTPVFDHPPAELLVAEDQQGPECQDEQGQGPANAPQDIPGLVGPGDVLSPEVVPDAPVQAQPAIAPNCGANVPAQTPETPATVMGRILGTLFSGELTVEQREEIRGNIRAFPEATRNEIYGRVFHLSPVENKEGDNWGEIHVLDNLEVLVDALSETLTRLDHN